MNRPVLHAANTRPLMQELQQKFSLPLTEDFKEQRNGWAKKMTNCKCKLDPNSSSTAAVISDCWKAEDSLADEEAPVCFGSMFRKACVCLQRVEISNVDAEISTQTQMEVLDRVN